MASHTGVEANRIQVRFTLIISFFALVNSRGNARGDGRVREVYLTPLGKGY